MRTLCWSLANLAASILAVYKRYKLDGEKKSARGCAKTGRITEFRRLNGVFVGVCEFLFHTATILSTEEGDEGDGV